VKTVRALKKRYGDPNLAVRRHRHLKKRTQGYGGSRKKLAATRRWLTRHAIPAPRKGHGRQGPKKRTFENSCRPRNKRDNGIRNRDLRQKVRPGSEKQSGRIFTKFFGLEVVKRVLRIFIGLRGVSGHYGGVGPLQNERRDYTQSKSRKCRNTGHSR
jgi:hypothetical protein